MCGWSASGSAFTRGVVNGSGGGHPRNVMESDLSNQQNILILHSYYQSGMLACRRAVLHSNWLLNNCLGIGRCLVIRH